jgi:adenylate cyclase class 2
MKHETEVKLVISCLPAEARRRIEEAGGRIEHGRVFEDNCLYDDPVLTLTRAGQVLRLRRAAPAGIETPAAAASASRPRLPLPGAASSSTGAWLTFKEPAGRDEGRYKVRGEAETAVEDADNLDTMLQRLGYRIIYRYQKYRTTFRAGSLEICLDETPIGDFLELEGEPDAIDAFAATLGYAPPDYIALSYRGLQEQRLAGTGREPGDMVFVSE